MTEWYNWYYGKKKVLREKDKCDRLKSHLISSHSLVSSFFTFGNPKSSPKFHPAQHPIFRLLPPRSILNSQIGTPSASSSFDFSLGQATKGRFVFPLSSSIDPCFFFLFLAIFVGSGWLFAWTWDFPSLCVLSCFLLLVRDLWFLDLDHNKSLTFSL